MRMSHLRALALAVAVTLCAAPALADSIDGSPIARTERQPPASVRGSPSILFEDHGVRGPFGTCGEDGYADTRCGADGAL